MFTRRLKVYNVMLCYVMRVILLSDDSYICKSVSISK